MRKPGHEFHKAESAYQYQYPKNDFHTILDSVCNLHTNWPIVRIFHNWVLLP